MEIWKDVVGYEGIYQASSLGRIRSLDRIGGGGKRFKGVVLSQGDHTCGYKNVVLYKDGKKISYTVHSLVALSFLGSRKNKLVIDHINGDKKDNRIENIRYLSQSLNTSRAERFKDREVPHGVYLVGDKYRVACSVGSSRSQTIGTFNTVDEAKEAYSFAQKNGAKKARARFLKGKTSNFIGVSFCRTTGTWRATATVNNKQINLGRHTTEKEALKARLAWEKNNGLC